MQNKKLIISILVVLLVVGVFAIMFASSRTVKEPQKSGNSLIIENVEKYLVAFADDKYQVDAKCSFDLYGYDEKYIYGFAMCQHFYTDVEGVEGGFDPISSISNDISDPMRLSYIGSNFKITGYESPTAVSPKDLSGTHPKDLLPEKYLVNINDSERFNDLDRQNFQKVIAGKVVDKKIALIIAYKENYFERYFRDEISAYPYGVEEIVGDTKTGWDIAIHLSISTAGPEPAEQNYNRVAGCYRVEKDGSARRSGVYQPKDGKKLGEINPKTCLPVNK